MKHQNKIKKPIIGITLGDINGIGPEIILKSLSDNRLLNYMTPVIYGSTKVLSYYKKSLGLQDLHFNQIKDEILPKRINVRTCWNETIEIKSGMDDKNVGKYAFLSLSKAVEDLKKGLFDALVTAPINKYNIQNKDFDFKGHTEYLAKEFNKTNYLMLMVSGNLRIGVVTGHLPVSKISQLINKELLSKKIAALEKSLKHDFSIQKPKIAVLGLNPHAGENGLLGEEEQKIIRPAIEELKQKGQLVFGPFAADGFFGSASYKKYDGVLAMYHDQGLIPFKTLSFNSGVNFTAGLSIVRTSPDHGTAYEIAGKNKANPDSFRNSLFLARDIVKNRAEHSVEIDK